MSATPINLFGKAFCQFPILSSMPHKISFGIQDKTTCLPIFTYFFRMLRSVLSFELSPSVCPMAAFGTDRVGAELLDCPMGVEYPDRSTEEAREEEAGGMPEAMVQVFLSDGRKTDSYGRCV